jgi:hypothetical protein
MVKNHLRPRFAKMLVEQVTLPVVIQWIDDLAASDRSPQTQRHAISTLSRFFSWAIERGHASINPVKMVPPSKRPVRASKAAEIPWLEDEKKVPEIVKGAGRSPYSKRSPHWRRARRRRRFGARPALSSAAPPRTGTATLQSGRRPARSARSS